MFLFLFLIALLGWFGLMTTLANAVFRTHTSYRRVKTTLLAIGCTVVPFGADFYAYYGFQIYCQFYSGAIKLEPVQTDSLAFERGVSEYHLLGHPALKHSQYLGNHRQWQSPPLSLSSNANDCQSAIHLKRINSRDNLNQRLAEQVEERGYCYSNEPLATKPKYLLRSDGTGATDYGPSQSALYIRDVRYNTNLVLVDTETDTVKAQFVDVWTEPGPIVRLLIPHSFDYKCEENSDRRIEAVFPYNSNIYRFLQKAIVTENG